MALVSLGKRTPDLLFLPPGLFPWMEVYGGKTVSASWQNARACLSRKFDGAAVS
eukprot:CAMPEP_0171056838 /NCGR_PEP_ID=MMETSP0766_2-20121228/1363_1 /TAXON_ID=439317 /ORGANISM="Gambierdiscus australes, Strain CAWD 149" /LENGTH=53 /DNA_ID=CAMNT_0011511835 /DNA_START=41 /DNA_END=198 /DNA_ORIENTATION=+